MTDHPTLLDRVIVAIHSADDCAAYHGGKPWLTDDWERYERMARAAIEAMADVCQGCGQPSDGEKPRRCPSCFGQVLR